MRIASYKETKSGKSISFKLVGKKGQFYISKKIISLWDFKYISNKELNLECVPATSAGWFRVTSIEIIKSKVIKKRVNEKDKYDHSGHTYVDINDWTSFK